MVVFNFTSTKSDAALAPISARSCAHSSAAGKSAPDPSPASATAHITSVVPPPPGITVKVKEDAQSRARCERSMERRESREGGTEESRMLAPRLATWRKERDYFVRQIIIFGKSTRVRKSRKSGNKAGQIL